VQDKDRMAERIKQEYIAMQNEINRLNSMISKISIVSSVQTGKKSIINIDVSSYKETINLQNIDELLNELNNLIGLKK
jgi:hypothetical protein